jgi:hypothetical protein
MQRPATPNHEDPRLQLEPAPGSARVWLFCLIVVLPLVITTVALGFAMTPDSPQRPGTGNTAVPWFTVLGGLALLTLVLWAVFDRLLRRHHLLLGTNALEVKTGFNRCRMAYADLKLDEARVVDLGERTELRPLLKLNGTGLPGFRSGWYLLRDRSRAFVAVAGGARALWIPGRGKHALLLQPRQPQVLLDALRAKARGDDPGA